jgi:hypothetical protein
MSRKRSNTADRDPLTTQRIAELAEVIASEVYVVGPQDQKDIIEALRELVDRRNADRIFGEPSGNRSVA